MSWNGAPGAIRTPDLLVRSQVEAIFSNTVKSMTCNSFGINVSVDLR